MKADYRIALAGNPNAGKSTIFNALTGGRQHVGNWPGKTVEMKRGQFSYASLAFDLIDLPGTYSLTAYSMEEIIARDYVIQEQPDAVIAVVDAGNLERNLYLVVQLIELGIPVIVALNMTDVAETRGLKIDPERLACGLQIPVIKTVATREQGLDELKACVLEQVKQGRVSARHTPDNRTTLHEAPHCAKCC
jgi:ferrous iron transport protein B